MTNIEQLHTKIVQQQQSLKQELDRLSVRLSAIERCRTTVSLQRKNMDSDEEEEISEEIVSNLKAIKQDLVTLKEQLQDRLEHSKHGLAMMLMVQDEAWAAVFYQYILDEVKLCLRDAKIAKESYDELIANIKEITRLRDQ